MPTPLPQMRTGRTLGRTLYLVTGDDWRDHRCIGIVDTPELAEAIVAAVNAAGGLQASRRPEGPPGAGC